MSSSKINCLLCYSPHEEINRLLSVGFLKRNVNFGASLRIKDFKISVLIRFFAPTYIFTICEIFITTLKTYWFTSDVITHRSINNPIKRKKFSHSLNWLEVKSLRTLKYTCRNYDLISNNFFQRVNYAGIHLVDLIIMKILDYHNTIIIQSAFWTCSVVSDAVSGHVV